MPISLAERSEAIYSELSEAIYSELSEAIYSELSEATYSELSIGGSTSLSLFITPGKLSPPFNSSIETEIPLSASRPRDHHLENGRITHADIQRVVRATRKGKKGYEDEISGPTNNYPPSPCSSRARAPPESRRRSPHTIVVPGRLRPERTRHVILSQRSGSGSSLPSSLVPRHPSLSHRHVLTLMRWDSSTPSHGQCRYLGGSRNRTR